MIETVEVKQAKEINDVMNLVVELIKVVKTGGDYTSLMDELITAIDGVGEIVIPNESLIRREGDLDSGEQALLATLRATKTIDGITVGYRWSGDIEYINVTSITVE